MGIFSNIFRSNKVHKREATNKVDEKVSVRVIGSKAFSAINSPAEAMKSSIVYRGISILSDAVASIPLSIYHKNKDGHFTEDLNHSLYRIFRISPSARQTSYEFLENIIVHMIVYGNAYILIKKDADYEVKELVLLYPNTVSYDELKNTYTVSDHYNNVLGEFKSDKIIHIRHKSLGTYVGQSVFTYAGRTIALANSTDKEALSTLEKGGKFKGIISSESSLVGFSAATDQQVDTVRDNLQAQIDSGNDILTLQSGTEWHPISQSMRDLQLVDLHNTTLSDLARYFGISPVKLGIATGGNYQASLQDSLNFYVDTLNPLLVKIERAFNKALIPSTVALKYKVEFDRTSIPYFKEILTNYQKMFELGLYSVNDIRKKLNMPMTEGGDITFISTNIQPVSSPIVDAADMDLQEEEQVIPEAKETSKEDKKKSQKNK
jgi:HK97 family phage portal protein